jgi:hypothetical protein
VYILLLLIVEVFFMDYGLMVFSHIRVFHIKNFSIDLL